MKRRRFIGKYPVKAKYYIPKYRVNTVAFRAIAALLAALIPLVLLDAKIRPIVKNSSSVVLNASITRIINNTVIDTLSQCGTEYADIIEITYNDEGSITSLSLNNVAANSLKSILTNDINDKLNEDQTRVMHIPWGTLTGIYYLSGRGTTMKLRITNYGYVLTDIRSEFTAAGINQTKHCIMLDVTVKIHGYIAATHISSEVKTSVIIAETIIVGSVPQVYFQSQLQSQPQLQSQSQPQSQTQQ